MYIDSPNISGSLTITGSLFLNGTAVTASGGGGGSGAGFPFSGSAVITGSLYVSGGNLSGSFAGDGSGLTNVTATIDQFATVNDTFTNVPSHSVVHNFGTKDVFVQVFESDDTLLIPQTVTTTNTNQVDIVFGDTLSGRVVIGKAGHILQDTGNFVSSSTAVQTFTNATTASINHYLDSFNVITQVFDSNNNVIVPSNIKVATKDRVDLTFASSRSGKVVIAKAGHIVSGSSPNADNATSASFATTAERVRAGDSGSRPTDYENITTGSLWYNTNTLALEVFTGVSASWWQPIASASVSRYIDSTPYNIEYLAIAGGGGGGYQDAGGGGAGGFLSSSIDNVNSGTVLTITVGAGAAGGTKSPAAVNSGTDTTIVGSGISTVTAIGGGGGSSDNNVVVAASGGSGGGGASGSGTRTGGSGTVGQGNDGGDGNASNQGGGGGGAGAAGQDANSSGANGGVGLISNILSSANATTSGVGEVVSTDVYYSGGGGGDNRTVFGNGGTGGGSNAAASPIDASANTGGGGGSAYLGSPVRGANGGSGVCILKVPFSNYSGTYTGSSVDVYTQGSYTVLVFKDSGTYTA